MSPAAIAQLAIILTPLVKDLVVEGSKIIATYKDNPTQDDINKALELSKSFNWPELSFEQKKVGFGTQDVIGNG